MRWLRRRAAGREYLRRSGAGKGQADARAHHAHVRAPTPRHLQAFDKAMGAQLHLSRGSIQSNPTQPQPSRDPLCGSCRAACGVAHQHSAAKKALRGFLLGMIGGEPGGGHVDASVQRGRQKTSSYAHIVLVILSNPLHKYFCAILSICCVVQKVNRHEIDRRGEKG
jgi:hypothetical protein